MQDAITFQFEFPDLAIMKTISAVILIYTANILLLKP